jgi:cell wall-associated NlpC family hydrolase
MAIMLPLIGRNWQWIKSDCWTLVRDYYAAKGLILPDWDRPPEEEFEDNPIFDKCWRLAGFHELRDDELLQDGDALLFNIHCDKPNHVGIFLADGNILHHFKNQLSRCDSYSRWLQQSTSRRLRHDALKP